MTRSQWDYAPDGLPYEDGPTLGDALKEALDNARKQRSKTMTTKFDVTLEFSGSKIPAIEVLRNAIAGFGLKEAKDAVEFHGTDATKTTLRMSGNQVGKLVSGIFHEEATRYNDGYPKVLRISNCIAVAAEDVFDVSGR